MTAIYVLDSLGLLSGPVELPVTPGIGIQVPANAVELPTELPPAAEGQVWGWVEGAPHLLEDHRGTVYDVVTGEERQQLELGPLSEGLTKIPKPSEFHRWQGGAWVKDLVAIHAAQVQAVNKSCERVIVGGFVSSALGAPNTYSSQLEDQLNLTGAILRGSDMPYACRDALGFRDLRPHTLAQLHQVNDDFTLFKLLLLQRSNELKQQLDDALAAGDADALEALVWSLEP